MANDTQGFRVSFLPAALAVLAAFAGGYLLGARGHGGPASEAPTAASIEDQEKALGPGSAQSDRFRALVAPDDPTLGADNALVTVVEFADFQEVYSQRAAATMKRLVQAYPNQVRLVFKQNPLAFHDQAELAAEAALAAGAQGKFWEYHDVLFTGGKLDRVSLEVYAERLGLDMTTFRAALDTRQFKARVEADQAQAMRLGARTVPTFFVNGRLLRGAQPYEQFQALVEGELKYAHRLMSDRQIAAAAVYAEIMRGARVDANAVKDALDPAKVYQVPVGDSPTLGKPTAKVTVVMFSEFDCVPCGQAVPVLNALVGRYGEDVRIVYKSFPMPGRPFSPAAAEAALAAGAQGKFWEYHDQLVAHPQALDDASLESYARNVGLDVSRWRAELVAGTHKGQVSEDVALAIRLGLRGTPTFFINGRPVPGVQALDVYLRVAEQEKARAETLLAAGAPPDQIYEALTKDGEAGTPPAPPQQRVTVRPVAPDPAVIYHVALAAGSIGPVRRSA